MGVEVKPEPSIGVHATEQRSQTPSVGIGQADNGVAVGEHPRSSVLTCTRVDCVTHEVGRPTALAALAAWAPIPALISLVVVHNPVFP